MHSHTPRLAIIDSRGLSVRQVAYYRRDISELIPETRATVQQHDVAGRLVAQRDPRFLAPIARPNLSTIYSLSSATLFTDSIDAGWRLGLSGEAGQVLECWDGRGSHWQNEYDGQLRPTAIHEQIQDSDLRTIERLIYADNTTEFAERNQCGQVIRHDDSAGTVWFKQQSLSGGLIRQTRRFLPDQADQFADWPAAESDSDRLLQLGEGDTTESRYSPLGEVLVQTDAGGHQQHFSVDRAGQLQRIGLTLKGQALQPLLKATEYNAEGQLLTQIAGNDVISTAIYEASTGRLERLTAVTSKRERLQELSYEYDAVGNIVRLVDHTQPVSYFANQRVAPETTYTYDSLDQLICAKGRETVDAGQNPGLPKLIIPSPIDPNRLLNYTEHYEYDAGGNRTGLRHESDKNPFTRTLRVDSHSNRALPWDEGEDEPDFKRQFDKNGNLQHLVPGAQSMTWDARNQLQSLTTVRRSSAANDGECYRYSAAGERVVKFSTQLAHAVTHQRIVHYLPGLEVRTTDDGEELQVICVPLARGSVRCLQWVKGQPDDIDIDQLRYSLDDHLGSSSLEVDKDAAVISHEGYYPYGGTAWWAARSQVDADYKTIRYSGKEQDACGLYYYGFRYYAPWLGRWVNPDPAGTVDGLNLYGMVQNNPIGKVDRRGLSAEIPELIAGAAVVGAVLIGALGFYFSRRNNQAQSAPPLSPSSLLQQTFNLSEAERQKVRNFNYNKGLVSDPSLTDIKGFSDGSKHAYAPKNPDHAKILKGSNSSSLSSQIKSGSINSVMLQAANAQPEVPRRATTVPQSFGFEVFAPRFLSRQKTANIAAPVDPGQAQAQAPIAVPYTVDVEGFKETNNYMALTKEQKTKVHNVIDEWLAREDISSYSYHKYKGEVKDPIFGMQKVYTIDLKGYDDTGGGRGDWRLVMYKIDGVYNPQRVSRHRDIDARIKSKSGFS
ncbi:RHS repeat protein [Pseudomonas sp. FW306-02-F02-AA]|nr:RHS repeat protein [Pseudomonas sp. FW306-02-F02-AB]PMZ07692.1 RHS repeat protein [Pseudomonas sp. FW306-02-H06C]PMZ13410.1 RHS repeat protein [Pseudomonas sp. FW306-02-F02-AA]PMZ19596.1 RHS repeat protein [Pseudomonas sp. FW306-02-F08-AA]PMZ25287.1 RHS repeat protein [Pseudomonas sp. FW306-02-F04-BA]PMZ32046.1 RHS repeat protein [Pseudomonas sp. FW306-02-H06B]PMZ38271.1 RHS repeat protein [Pseudomonas sp. FW306-2-11AB]PMZ44307.1 RHS repeat protein [Pseudomonas sp. FW306-02-H05-AA]PMZ504